jgi:uncharacterized protein YjcR
MASKIDCSLYLVSVARERGYTWKEIAGALGCSAMGLHSYLKRHGWQKPERISTERPQWPIDIEALRCHG